MKVSPCAKSRRKKKFHNWKVSLRFVAELYIKKYNTSKLSECIALTYSE